MFQSLPWKQLKGFKTGVSPRFTLNISKDLFVYLFTCLTGRETEIFFFFYVAKYLGHFLLAS